MSLHTRRTAAEDRHSCVPLHAQRCAMSDHNSSDRCDATPAMGTAVSVSSGAAPPPLPAAAPSASNPEVASGAGAAARTGAGDGAGAGATGTGDKDDLFPARSARVATSRATGLVYDQRMRLHEDPTGPHPGTCLDAVVLHCCATMMNQTTGLRQSNQTASLASSHRCKRPNSSSDASASRRETWRVGSCCWCMRRHTWIQCVHACG